MYRPASVASLIALVAMLSSGTINRREGGAVDLGEKQPVRGSGR
jgi:hypothetical protein